MLLELAVHDLGVIADLDLVLEPGVTALTGETGAGKTLVVEALELLVGGRADALLVRPGADEARVEGRFTVGPGGRRSVGAPDGEELVLARVVPRTGRSRAYVDGRLSPVAALAEHGARLVDLHGQHAHQSLLAGAVQRAALDRFGAVDVSALAAARARLGEVEAALAGLGGDARSQARETDLLRFQLAELDDAGLDDPDEEAALEAEEGLLADAAAHRRAAADARQAVTGDGGAGDALGAALAALAGRAPFSDLEDRLRSVAAEAADLAGELRAREESIEEDPERLERVLARRRLLRDLRRKYGETLADVMGFAAQARDRLAELTSHDARVTELEGERSRARAEVDARAAEVGRARRAAAPGLGEAVEAHLRELALPKARFEVDVGDDDPGDAVVFLFGANPGEPVLPLSRVASGGELARAMLALRLVLRGDEGPATLVFDEVDAGVGGEAALAVGRALAALGDERQVLVVTHLPQVAAFADHQVAVSKVEAGGRTVASARPVRGPDRVVELSRMLSGQPGSRAAQGHAEELLGLAASSRDRPSP